MVILKHIWNGTWTLNYLTNHFLGISFVLLVRANQIEGTGDPLHGPLTRLQQAGRNTVRMGSDLTNSSPEQRHLAN